jgi:coiled-coil domain-containing protein 130
VRYNAQKSKVGNYYSTPIFAFRCKCHLCDGWFDIRTDPQNARYVVVEGARQKEETWDPAENGGYAVYDTEAASASASAEVDPFAALEKDTDQQSAVRVRRNRMDELGAASARIAADPYAVSRQLRDRFRAEKREALAKQKRDDGVLEKYGLDDTLQLGSEAEDPEASARTAQQWSASRENRGLPAAATAQADLGSTIRKNTAARAFDVFGGDAEPTTRIRLKRKSDVAEVPKEPPASPPKPPPPLTLLAGYGSSEEDEDE